MNKAFTKESDNDTDDELPDAADALPAGVKYYITPEGLNGVVSNEISSTVLVRTSSNTGANSRE